MNIEDFAAAIQNIVAKTLDQRINDPAFALAALTMAIGFLATEQDIPRDTLIEQVGKGFDLCQEGRKAVDEHR